MNFLFPDVGVAASATARQAPRAPQTPTPGAAQNGSAPTNGPAAPPATPSPEAAFAEFQRMHTEAMRTLQQRAQQRQQQQAAAAANGTPQQQQQGAPSGKPTGSGKARYGSARFPIKARHPEACGRSYRG
ncbi:hypothetical protein EXIGLDRAFT_725814 [Exidia glandulosa HHB12029]|uniref:Uncharacterized protein n=1 Tax=Exidia glandulosa HHB12029 TaxID=1314781 RepID=A0A165QBN5_EXIGL|nr:hypothetical protein EXIGLDRAFT_725814 [Exidia glandulosa HHB12029]